MGGKSGAAFLLALLSALCARAQIPEPRAFEGQRIISVRFEPAEQPLSPDQLSRFVLVKPDTLYRAADLRASIKRLYETGEYEYIEADGEPANGGVAIVFRTAARWFIGWLHIASGIKRSPTRGEIAGAADLELGQPFSAEGLKAAVDRVRPVLEENGFFEAKVSSQLTRDPRHQQMNIRIIVDPGKRARFSEPVVTGQPGMEAEEISEATHWHRLLFGWKPVTAANTQNGLQRLRKKYTDAGRLMASISIAKMEYHPETGTVTPFLHVLAGPKVHVLTEGASVSSKKLKRYVPVYDERAVYQDLLVEGARNLRDYFQLQGYFDAKVSYSVRPVEAGHEDIIYKIAPGLRRKLVHVGVEGNHYFSVQSIRDRMLIQPAGWLWFEHGKYNEAFVRNDIAAIQGLYQSNGFRDARVRIVLIENYAGKRNQVAALVRIVEGPQYLVSKLTITGMKQIRESEVVPNLSSAEGQPFSELNVAIDRNYIIRLYNRSGYPNAAFSWTMEPGPGPHQMRIDYRIVEGERQWVRDVLVGGVERTSPGLLASAFEIHRGDPLSPQAMTGTQEKLYNLGIFDMVNTAVQNPDGETADKYVLYQVREGAPWQIAGGVGAESARIGGGNQLDFTAPAGKTGFSPRVSVNATRINTWGLGQTITLSGLLSTIEQTGQVNYLIPRFRNATGRDITLTGLYDRSFNVNTFNSERLLGQVQMSQPLSRASTLLWSFSYSRTGISNLKINPLLVPLLSQPARIGLLSGNYVQDRRDDPVNPRRGIYNTLNLGVSSSIFGSQSSFTRLLGNNATYYTLRRNLVIARRIQFGWIAPFAVASGIPAAQSVPLSQRFFAGGSMTNRGFPENQAGPRDLLTGFPLGGNALLFHNTEFRFPLYGNVGGVLFHDMGNVYTSISDISFRVHQPSLVDFNYMVHAVGFGLRYATPIGPVRADFAYSINPPRFFGLTGTPQQLLAGTAPRVLTGISHFQFFISLGQAF
jgi:outer membrane protein insertion porin family